MWLTAEPWKGTMLTHIKMLAISEVIPFSTNIFHFLLDRFCLCEEPETGTSYAH